MGMAGNSVWLVLLDRGLRDPEAVGHMIRRSFTIHGLSEIHTMEQGINMYT